MEFLNIGIFELVFILLLMLVLLGPDGMAKTARSLAKGIRQVYKSPFWRNLLQTTQDIKDLPNNLIREAGIEELQKELQGDYRYGSQPPMGNLPPEPETEHSIKPLDLQTQTKDTPITSFEAENQPDESQPKPPAYYPVPYQPSDKEDGS